MGKSGKGKALSAHKRLLIIAALLGFSVFGDALLYAVLPTRPDAFSVTVWQVGILLSANRFVRLVTNEIAGRIRRGNRTVAQADRHLIAAAIIGGLITAGYALPWGFAWLLSLRLLWGASWSVLWVGGSMTAIEGSTEGNRGRVVGGFQGLVRFSQSGVVLVGGALTDLIGPAGAFLLFAIAGLAGTLWAGRTLMDMPSRDSRHPVIGPATRRDGRSGEATDRADHAAPVRLWILIFAVMMSGESVANLTGALVVDRVVGQASLEHASATVTGVLLGVWEFSSLPLGYFLGYLGDRFGRLRTLAFVLALQLLVVCAVGLNGEWYALLAGLFIYLVIASGVRGATLAVAADHVAGLGGDVQMGRISTVSDASRAVSPLAAFAIYSRFGTTGAGYFVAALLVVTLLVLSWHGRGFRLCLIGDLPPRGFKTHVEGIVDGGVVPGNEQETEGGRGSR